jgi:hypothetical protein
MVKIMAWILLAKIVFVIYYMKTVPPLSEEERKKRIKIRSVSAPEASPVSATSPASNTD